jgi:hypothetical protein
VNTYCARIRGDASLMQTLLESPLTRRAYTKPRGYAGDALDNDVESVREVDRCYKGLGVTPQIGGVRDLLSRRKEIGSFDLVYATGLYDYLNQKTARALTSVLLTAIRPDAGRRRGRRRVDLT